MLQTFSNTGQVVIVNCVNASCINPNVKTLSLPIPGVISRVSLAVRPSGRPLFTYGVTGFGRSGATVVDCRDPNCDRRTLRVPPVETPYTILALRPDGLPLIAYLSVAAGILGCTTPQYLAFDSISFP